MKKIIIIGAGDIGSHIASALIWKKIPVDLILVDKNDKLEKAQVLDLKDLTAINNQTKISHGDFCDENVRDGDIFVITAGLKHGINKSRLDLLNNNIKILKDIKKKIGKLKKTAIVILISNPVDILTFEAIKIFNLPKNQIFGSGTFLDTLRLKWRLLELGFTEKEVEKTLVLGEHGDSSFIHWGNFFSRSKICEAEKEELENKIKKGAYEIIKGKGSTYFGIGGATAEILESIILENKKIFPLSVFIENENTVISMPATLSKEGIKKIIFPKLSHEEENKYKKSIEMLKSFQ